MNLNRIRIGTRLSIGFGSLMALLAFVAAMAAWQIRQLGQDFHDVVVMEERAAAVLEWHDLTYLNMSRAMAITKSNGHARVKDFYAPRIEETAARIGVIQQQLEAEVTTEAGKDYLVRIGAARTRYFAARDKVFEAVLVGEVDHTEKVFADLMQPAAQAYVSEIDAFHDYERKLAAERESIVKAKVNRSVWAAALLGVIGVVLGAAFAWRITRSVTRPLRTAVGATRAIASGDLSQRMAVEGKDEVSELQSSLGDMQQSLQKLIGEVRSTTDNIATASSEIAAGTYDLSTRTEQAASNLQQTASSMEQLTSTVKQTADSARTANQLASSAQASAAKGGEVVSQVVSTMEDINASSKKIADIIGVIDGIAFQTNILALNAAVEAARAGEQGRGFAVVASEVRSLAQRSANAAKEIKGLIGASVDKVESGSRLVADAGHTMTEIVGSVQRVSDIIGEITAAAGEQSEGIGQVNNSVTQLDQMTQQNAALVEQSAAAAESLKDQAAKLAASVATFKVGNAGKAASPAPAVDKPKPALPAPAARSTAIAIATVKAAAPARSAPAQPKAPAKPVPRAVAAAAAPVTAPVTAVAHAAASAPAGGDWETF